MYTIKLFRVNVKTFVFLFTLFLSMLALSASAANRKLVGRPEFYAYHDSQFSPDSGHLVFKVTKLENDDPGLYSRPTAGGSAIQLNRALGEDWEISNYLVSPDSKWVVYRIYNEVSEGYELFKVPIEGPADAGIKLVGPSSEQAIYIGQYMFSPDSLWVIFKSDVEEDGVEELFRVSIDGKSLTKLSGPMVTGGDVKEFDISLDGNWVVYLADQDANMHDELYSVPLTGDSANHQKLNHAIRKYPIVCMPSEDTGRDKIDSFKISPDGNYVVYKAKTIVIDSGECEEVNELFSARLNGPTNAVQIQDSSDEEGFDVITYQIGPNSNRVVYIYMEKRVEGLRSYNIHELYSVPIQGPAAAAVKLHPSVSGDRDVDDKFKISSSTASTRVIYVADLDDENKKELYSVPIEGGATTKLNPSLLPDADVDVWNYKTSPDGQRVVFSIDMGRTYPDYALFSVPAAGPGHEAVEISGPMTPDGSVYNFEVRFVISSNSQWVAYRADQDSDEVYELYRVPINGPQGNSVKINELMQPEGDVKFAQSAYWFSPDSQWLAYVADQEIDGVYELFISGEDGVGSQIYLPLLQR